VANLQTIAQQQPLVHQRLMLQWSMHADIADRHLLDLSTGPVRDRVLRLLAMLKSISNGPDTLLLPNNQDCAALLGARIESVSRCMAELKRNQILVRDGKAGWRFQPAPP
jgi:CRP-like cAMP-binding protein